MNIKKCGRIKKKENGRRFKDKIKKLQNLKIKKKKNKIFKKN